MYCLLWPVIYLCCGFLFIYAVNYFLRRSRLANLSSRHILITGCDSGFGQLAARRLAGLGCRVWAGCLTQAGQERLRGTVPGGVGEGDAGSCLQPLSLDVTNEESVRRAYEFIKAKLPAGKGLWAMINNAGIAGSSVPVEWLTLQDYRDVCDVNLFGLIDVTTTFLPLIKLEQGRVINTASMFGRISWPRATPYCISKFGVVAFSEGIRRQLRPYGISVHLIEPGFFKTDMLAPTLDKTERKTLLWRRVPESVRVEYGEQYLQKIIESEGPVFSAASDKLHAVVDAYEHAATAVFPRDRYVVIRAARCYFLSLLYLPTWLADHVIRITTNPPIPAALQEKNSHSSRI